MRQSLTEGAIANRLFKLTLPMVWGIFAIVAFNLADTYYVGAARNRSTSSNELYFSRGYDFGKLGNGIRGRCYHRLLHEQLARAIAVEYGDLPPIV